MNYKYKIVLLLLFVIVTVNIHAQDFLSILKTSTSDELKYYIVEHNIVNLNFFYNGATPLMWAAHYNIDPQVITVLLEKGGNPVIASANGETALHWSVFNDNQDVVSTLLTTDIDPNVKTKTGATALIYAAQYSKNPEVVQMLLAKIDKNIQDNSQRFAYNYAMYNVALRNTPIFDMLKPDSNTSDNVVADDKK